MTEIDAGRLSLAWDQPQSDGGSPLTGYVVEMCRSGSATGYTKAAHVDSNNLTVELTGLTEGEFYFVRVFSENQVGLSKRGSELEEPVCARRPQSKLLLLSVMNSFMLNESDATYTSKCRQI